VSYGGISITLNEFAQLSFEEIDAMRAFLIEMREVEKRMMPKLPSAPGTT
jgi:hypothetical protein